MGLGERIAEAIEGSGKSKAQIARECEVTNGAVSQWLSGSVKSLKAETAIALEAATGFRAYWLLHGRGPKTLAEPRMAWPFRKVSLDRLTALDEGDLGYVERRLLQAIAECEILLNPNGVAHSDEASTHRAQTNVQTPQPNNSLPTSSAHQIEQSRRPEESDALTKAIKAEGKQQRGPGSSTGGVPQSGTRRRMPGAVKARGKG